MEPRQAIPCCLLPEVKERIRAYAEDLKSAAHSIGDHQMNPQEFVESGLFQAAVERLRGTQSATMTVKHRFLRTILDYLQTRGRIVGYTYTGAGDRHDYQISMPNGRTVVFEAKGCLDGNNTTIFTRPSNADEFFIWSLCQNSGADPQKNAWSGIHTRLGGTILAEQQRVDGLIIWDMVCGTAGRPCPKLQADTQRAISIGDKTYPPPCIYLFPRTIPDPRNNPEPPSYQLADLSFFAAIAEEFRCTEADINSVSIAARMNAANIERRTKVSRNGQIVAESMWTELKRAR